MKATGVVRKVDELGRVVVPTECRRKLGINIKDPIEISVNGEYLVLTKYIPRCVFCKGVEDVAEMLGRHICRQCIDNLQKL